MDNFDKGEMSETYLFVYHIILLHNTHPGAGPVHPLHVPAQPRHLPRHHPGQDHDDDDDDNNNYE